MKFNLRYNDIDSIIYTELREDINNIIKEWHFGAEEMFDNTDLEDMTSDIMKAINKNNHHYYNYNNNNKK